MLNSILSITLPVFVLIGVGYLTARFRLLSQQVGEALGQYVYVIAIPVLIFRTLSGVDLNGQSPWALWATYFSGILVAWTAGTLVTRHIFKRDARAGVIGGISAGFANTVMVGIPLVTQVYGDEGLIAILVIISIHLPVMTVVASVLMERAAAIDSETKPAPLGTQLQKIGKSLATNPIAIAIVCSLLWRSTGFPVTGILEDVLTRIAATALPVALLSLGMSMVLYGLRGNILPGLSLSLIKMLLMPAVVFVMGAYVLHLPPLWACVATLTAACPTGVNAYIFANRFGTGHAMSTNAITVTTAAAVLTCGIWVYLVEFWRAGL